MKAACGEESDVGLAAILNVAAGTVASWRHRDSVPLEHVLAFATKEDCDVEWLLSGAGRRERAFILPDIDPEILAIAIERAQATARHLEAGREVEVSELAQIITTLYSNTYRLYLEILEASKMPRADVIKLIRRSNDLPEIRRQYTFSEEGLRDSDEVTEEALARLIETLADLAGRRS